MDLNLKGRVAVAAGGANGAGREIALALVGEGAAVAVNHRSSGGDAAKAVVGESEAEGVWAITCGALTSLISMSFKRRECQFDPSLFRDAGERPRYGETECAKGPVAGRLAGVVDHLVGPGFEIFCALSRSPSRGKSSCNPRRESCSSWACRERPTMPGARPAARPP